MAIRSAPRLVALAAVLVGACLLSLPAARSAPDEELLGKSAGYPVGDYSNWNTEGRRVGSFSLLDSFAPHHRITRSETPRALPRAGNEPSYTYRFDRQSLSLGDFLDRRRVTGLMVVKDGVVQVERYQYDRKPEQRFLSNSMAKSVVSIAVGVALAEGKIRSLDDTAATYVPELAGSAYGETPIRALLRMASGMPFTETYNGKDDLSRFFRIEAEEGTFAAIRFFRQRDVEPSSRFQYASIETMVLTYVVIRATGKSLSAYVSERLWRPMGAEADATWIINPGRIERGYGFLNATLRDWARLAALLAEDGQWEGRQIIPRDYLIEATDKDRHPAAFRPRTATPYYGYGYQFWTHPSKTRRFALLGVHGQSIFVDPSTRSALVITAVQNEPDSSRDGFGHEREELWRGILGQHGGTW